MTAHIALNQAKYFIQNIHSGSQKYDKEKKIDNNQRFDFLYC